jgi:molybdopterin-containing oxidoreductase family membrane subunit
MLLLNRPEAWRSLSQLFAVGLFLAIFLSGGVGALLGVNASRAYWHIGLPGSPIFPFFSLATGHALSWLLWVGLPHLMKIGPRFCF